MSKRTPGPWKINLNGALLEVNSDSSITHLGIITQSDELTYKEFKRVTNIIEAAPEMLNALDRALGILISVTAVLQSDSIPIEREIAFIKSIITKAQGK